MRLRGTAITILQGALVFWSTTSSSMGLAAYSNVLKGFNGLIRVTRSGHRHVSSSDTQNNITYNRSSQSRKAFCPFFWFTFHQGTASLHFGAPSFFGIVANRNVSLRLFLE